MRPPSADIDERTLVYLNNRYHDPTLGTFISVDPLVTATGEPYIYASGNPTTLSDPLGLDPYWSQDQDPCNDSGYYQCGRHDGGGKKGQTYVSGPGQRQLDERSRGIGLPAGVANSEQSRNMLTFISAEMMMNRADPWVQAIRPSGCDLLCTLSGAGGVPGQLAASTPSAGDVVAIGLEYFRAGGIWDHKDHIRSYTGNAEWIMIDNDRAVRFDTLSNVHYGFIFAEMGVAESIAQVAANGGELWEPLTAVTGTNDASDRLAISIGYQLHDLVPGDPGSLLAYNEGLQAVFDANFDALVSVGGACAVADC